MAQMEGENSDQPVAEVPAEEVEDVKPALNTLYPSFVRTLQEAEEVMHRFENNTKSRFCVWRSPKDFGHSGLNNKKKKVYWNEFTLEYREREKIEKGTPFVLMGKKIFDCHHGKDRSLAMKRRAEQRRQELNEKRKRILTTPGKKINCPAQVVFTEVVIFPTYKLASDTQYSRKQASKTLKSHFTEGLIDNAQLDRRIYISLPGDKVHVGHQVGEGCDSCERMHNKVADKITEFVAEGITGSKEMKRRLDVYVRTDLCPELWKPCHSNRRYYPTTGVIRNKMYNAYIKRRLAMIDQERIGELVKELQHKNTSDKFFLKTYSGVDELRLHATTGITVEEELEDELKIRQQIAKQQFVFVHQTSFQIHLMERYGNHVCFLDPVYRTMRYALPVYFVVVKTNVDYQTIATIVIQDESCESIKEAVEILKNNNPEWQPQIFLCDNDPAEIRALAEIFEGCKVFISGFHRQQAWERWLSQSTNNMTPYKDAILNHLRILADSTTRELYRKAFQTLESSEVWNDTFGKVFRSWFENTWLTVKEHWVWAFQAESFATTLSTNNTVEWQSKDFAYEQLCGHGDALLSEMIKYLVETFLPAKRDAYCELNAEISATTSKYTNLPDFFRNRPRCVIDHITERITTSYEISTDDITVHSYKEGEFLVNCRRSDVEYKVLFGNAEKLPRCECDDWSRNMLPCKHFIAIMRDFKEWSWSRFPETYRSSPYLTLDAVVNPNATDVQPTTSETSLAASEAMVSVLDSSQFQELMIPKQSGKSKSGSCRELLNEINNFTYVLSDDDVINHLNATLEKVLTDMKLAFVDDEVAIVEELVIKPAKAEETPKKTSHSSKKTKRASTSSASKPNESEENNEPAKKVAKVESDGQGSTTYTASETIEEPVLEEMNHMEILNMDYYRSLSNVGEAGTPGNNEQNVSGNPEPKGNSTEPQGNGNESRDESALLAQLDYKKDGDVTITDTKIPSSLPKYEARLVQRKEMLTADSINLAQSLLHEAFPNLKGLQNVAHGAVQAFEPVSGDFIQILHDGNLHWVCTSNVALGVNRDPAAVFMYDSVNQGFIAKFTKQQLASFLCIQCSEMKVVMKSVQQCNAVDCGVFAIAFATALAFGQDPSKQRLDVAKMRPHLVECLKSKKMSPFPEQSVVSGDTIVSKRKFFTVELFCSCRMPYEKPKSEGDLMAQCGNCKEWFHQRCEKIALEIFKASGMSFFCSACLKKVQV